jgi:hypothetical protein
MKYSKIQNFLSRLLIQNASGETINPATAELQEITVLLKNIFSTIQLPRNADTTNNADRVNVINTVPVTGTIAVSTVTTAGNMTAFNGVQAHQISVATEIQSWYITCRSRII